MDWLKSILQSLPLEKISDILGEIVIWWSQMVKGVTPADLPMYAYIGGAIVVLALWILVARMLPKPLGGMSWMILFAVLFAPGTALSDPSTIAPASISVVYAVMMKDTAAAVNNALPVMVVLVVGLFIGFVWQLIRGAFESSLEEARRRTAVDTEANMQLAGGNYIAERNVVLETQPEKVVVTKTAPQLTKTEISLEKAVKSKMVAEPKKSVESEKSGESEKVLDSITLPQKKKEIQGFYSKRISTDIEAEKSIKNKVNNKADNTNNK